MAYNKFFRQDIVDVDGMQFENLEVAIEYITENWMDFLGIGKYDYDRPELTEVKVDDDVNMVVVRYIRDLDEEDSMLSEAEMMEEYFDITYKQLIVKVPELHLI